MSNQTAKQDTQSVEVGDKTVHVIFQDPPASGRRGRQSKWVTVVDQLKASPNQWALLIPSTKSAQTATYLRQQYGLDATIRKVDEEGNVAIYARYVPAEDTEVSEELVSL